MGLYKQDKFLKTALRKKCPNMEFFLVRFFLYSDTFHAVLLTRQKQAVQIMNNKTHFEHTAELLKSQEILNFVKLNIFNIAMLMYKVNSNTAPTAFHGSFSNAQLPNNVFKI